MARVYFDPRRIAADLEASSIRNFSIMLLAVLATAVPTLADTVGPGEMPPWPIDCDPIEPLRIREFPVLPILTEVLPSPTTALFSTAQAATFAGSEPEPVPAPVTIAAVGWIMAVVVGALMLKGKSA